MFLQSNFALLDESARDIASCLSHRNSFLVPICLRQAQSEEDNEHWWAGSEPEERSPGVAGSVNQTSRKDRSKKISKGISLL